MTYDDETLGRYVDGELDARAVAALEAEMTRDAALADRVADIRILAADLRGAYADVLSEEVPKHLRRAVLTMPTDLIASPPARRGVFGPWRLPAFLSCVAGAAGLALGLVLAPASMLTLDGNGHLVAGGALAAALQDGLASEPGAQTLIGVTFRGRDGAWCRSFETAADQAALAGLACRSNGVWRVETAAATPARTGAYAQASAAMPDAVRQAVAARLADAPLDAAAERAARDSGWK